MPFEPIRLSGAYYTILSVEPRLCVVLRPDVVQVPRFFSDIDNGEMIQDTRGHELTDWNATRLLTGRAASVLIVRILQETGAVRARVDVWSGNGECILGTLGHGAVLIAGSAGASQIVGACDETHVSGPRERATQHATAAR